MKTIVRQTSIGGQPAANFAWLQSETYFHPIVPNRYNVGVYGFRILGNVTAADLNTAPPINEAIEYRLYLGTQPMPVTFESAGWNLREDIVAAWTRTLNFYYDSTTPASLNMDASIEHEIWFPRPIIFIPVHRLYEGIYLRSLSDAQPATVFAFQLTTHIYYDVVGEEYP